MRRLFSTFLISVILAVSVIGILELWGEYRNLQSPELNSPPPPRTPPLSRKGFRAEQIISNDNFYRTDTMTAKEIDDFITAWGRGCRSGTVPCLKDYRADLSSYPADRYCTREVRAGHNLSVGEVVFRVSQSCGVNPQVILTTLQKEQGLITASGPQLVPIRYLSAMGYACPDGSQCDPRYQSFEKQIYYAARQLQQYRLNPGKFRYRAGQTAAIPFDLDSSCGAARITLQNEATAALYNYTPYQPSNHALAGETGPCAQVGNLNFYSYFKAWFGEPNGNLRRTPLRP